MRVTVEAPAKVNLYLAAGAKARDGYHHVDTVLLALDLCDGVTVGPAPSLSLVCEPGVGCPAERNLAWRAAVALADALGREPGVAMRIAKRVPHGAGLGGGSADAAAVLAALCEMWQVRFKDPIVEAVARSIGVDVPFFLEGGCALYGGRGDRRIRALPTPDVCLALVDPGIPVSTRDAYAAFDERPPGHRPGPAAVTDALRREDAVALGEALFNNMTEASSWLVPQIGEALTSVAGTGCLGAAMAGSGSCAFGIFADDAGASAAVRRAKERGWWATIAHPRGDGTLASIQTGGGS